MENKEISGSTLTGRSGRIHPHLTWAGPGVSEHKLENVARNKAKLAVAT